MQHCSKEEALLWLFYNLSASLKLLFIILSLSFIFLENFFHFLGTNPTFPRSRNGYEHSEEEEEEEEEGEEETSYVVDDHLLFRPKNDVVYVSEELFTTPQESIVEEEDDDDCDHHQNYATELLSVHDTDLSESEFEYSDHDHDEAQKIPTRDNNHNHNQNHIHNHDDNKSRNISDSLRSCVTIDLRSRGNNFVGTDKIISDDYGYDQIINGEKHFSSGDEKFLSFAPTQLETKKYQIMNKEKDIIHDINNDAHHHHETYGDSCTVGSTSKSSSDWRSSINFRDSGTDQDPFSSSSRRSCPKWESYTIFQKYDEEMMVLDRISAQKLHETESLKSIKVTPRSVSERIVHKFMTANKTPKDIRRNPYHELEVAYVAQICLTWEALNWNYKNFQQKRALHREFDPGSSGKIAQHFQQFQVLLQRYIENEPYEQGRRPEVYARMRLLAPKLLQVPEYRDSEDHDQREDGLGSRISSPSFLIIMEDCIYTFMNFLKADKEKTCQLIISSLFKRKRRGSVDPTLLHLMKKVNQKKKMKLKDLRRSRKCLRKRKLKVNEEMEIVMGLIDLKVVSRVLRMKELNEEQRHWCEEKMSKVKILDGKLQRDSLPLFFPAH